MDYNLKKDLSNFIGIKIENIGRYIIKMFKTQIPLLSNTCNLLCLYISLECNICQKEKKIKKIY